MAHVTANIAKGRVVELYRRVEENDPANCALIVVPLETSGLESDATLTDKDTLADLLSGATNEQTTMGRKTLTDADLAAFPAPDDVNDRFEISLPNVSWANATGNAISKLAICYDPDTTAGTDATIVPLTLIDFVATPDGTNIEATGAVFYRAS